MFTDSELDILSRAFLFRGRSPEDTATILGAVPTTRLTFPKNAVIYSPLSFRRELGIILSGSVTVTKGALTVSELSPGDLFGAAALFTDEDRYVSTLTAREKCDIVFLAQSAVWELLERFSDLRSNYIRYLAQRIRFLSARVDALTEGGGGRLSSFLLRSADSDGRVTVRSMTELASRLGIGRASLYRELAKLADQGIISHTGKTVTLLKPELLK